MRLTKFVVPGSANFSSFYLPQYNATSNFGSRSLALKIHQTSGGPVVDINSGNNTQVTQMLHTGTYVFYDEIPMMHYLQRLEQVVTDTPVILFRGPPAINGQDNATWISPNYPTAPSASESSITAYLTKFTGQRKSSDLATRSSNFILNTPDNRFTVSASFQFTVMPSEEWQNQIPSITPYWL